MKPVFPGEYLVAFHWQQVLSLFYSVSGVFIVTTYMDPLLNSG